MEHFFSATERVRVVQMEDSSTMKPRGEAYPPTVIQEVNYMYGDSNTVSDDYLKEIDLDGERVAWAVERFRHGSPEWRDAVSRYFRLVYDSDTLITTDGRLYAVTLATPEWKRATGSTGLTESDVEPIWNWVNGEVYGLVHDKLIWNCSHGHPTQWVEQDSVWGFYGAPDDVETLARDYFPIGEKR